MAAEAPGCFQFSFPADVDMSDMATDIYSPVAVGNAANVAGFGKGNAAIVAYNAANTPVGILQNNPMQGEAGAVMFRGMSRCRCGTAWKAGQRLTVQDAHTLKPAGTGDTVLGWAVFDADVGDLSSIMLTL